MRLKKSHYRFDFDLDLDNSTGHDSHEYGCDSLIYVSLQPIRAEKKEWTTYIRAHSKIGEEANLQAENLKVDGNTVTIEVVSNFFRDHEQFGLYVMTYSDGIFYDEVPNNSETLIDLPKKDLISDRRLQIQTRLDNERHRAILINITPLSMAPMTDLYVR